LLKDAKAYSMNGTCKEAETRKDIRLPGDAAPLFHMRHSIIVTMFWPPGKGPMICEHSKQDSGKISLGCGRIMIFVHSTKKCRADEPAYQQGGMSYNAQFRGCPKSMHELMQVINCLIQLGPRLPSCFYSWVLSLFLRPHLHSMPVFACRSLHRLHHS